jgi:hypothetical protein
MLQNVLLLEKSKLLEKGAARTYSYSKSWRVDKLREYLEKLKVDLHLNDVSDWYRVSRFQVIEAGGINKYHNVKLIFSRKRSSNNIWKSW